jgi:hypothetical protein
MRILFLLGLLLPGVAFSDELTLHFIPPPKPMHWSTPKRLAWSAVWNQVAPVNAGNRHEIGHVYVELQCGETHLFTGVTSEGNSEERRNLLKEGYGLGVLTKTYAGKFDDPSKTEADLHALQKAGRSNFLRFGLSSPTCSRLLDYLDKYRALGYQKTYAGLNARPHHRQSAGCSAFGASFLELAGLQTPEFEKAWQTHKIIPKHLLGGPSTGRKVKLIKILTEKHSHWDEDLTRDGTPIDFWDPEKMHDWVEQAVSDLENEEDRTLPWPGKVVQSLNSPGLFFDVREVPTPTGPIFRAP